MQSVMWPDSMRWIGPTTTTPSRVVAREPGLDDTLAALLDKARAGDDGAFASWVGHVTPMLFRLALRLCGDSARADDLVQDAVVRAWQGLAGLRDAKASRAWVCRILRNAATDDVRRRARRNERSLDAFPTDDRGVYPLAAQLVSDTRAADDVFADAETRAFVRAVLETLPEQFRLALTLHDIDGLSQEDVAAALDIPIGTVASRISRARAKLTTALQGLAGQRRWRFL